MIRAARHLAAVSAFAALAAFWLAPALRAPAAIIPGDGAGDNLTFVWNTWWMHQAVSTGQSPLWTPMLFAPWGTSLALNTHAAGPSLLGAALLPRLGSAMAATTMVIAVHLFLNFLVSYVLAFRLTRSHGSGVVAAVVFGCSPYVGVHLHGHFNLVAAWVLPLSALATLSLLDRGRPGSVIAAGVVWGTLVYVDYYYAVFAAVMVAAILGSRAVGIRLVRRDVARTERLALGAIAACLTLIITVVIVIAVSGGTTIRAGGLSISMRGTDNPVAAGGLLLMLAGTIWWSRRVRIALRLEVLSSDLRRIAAPLAIAAILSAPVLVSIVRLWSAGDYISQRYLWRSAPPGIDLLTAVLGNPAGLVTGPLTQRAYAALGIDVIEQSGWLGPAVIILCAIALRARRTMSRASHPCHPCDPWLIVFAIFATWAIGPYLVAAGARLWVLLPATVVRFIPLISNARIPSRAMIVVSLAAAMLAALAWRHLQEQNRPVLAFGLALLLLVDYFPARPPFFTLDRPSVYDVLATQPGDGTVCELPLGIRDGFGERGRLDTRILAYQTRHGRPLAGGFVARLSPRLAAAYESDAILGPLLRLSAGAPMDAEPPLDRQTAGARLLAHGIRYVVVDEQTAPAGLMTWVDAHVPLRMIARDSGRRLYVIDAVSAGSPPSRSTARPRP